MLGWNDKDSFAGGYDDRGPAPCPRDLSHWGQQHWVGDHVALEALRENRERKQAASEVAVGAVWSSSWRDRSGTA